MRFTKSNCRTAHLLDRVDVVVRVGEEGMENETLQGLGPITLMSYATDLLPRGEFYH